MHELTHRQSSLHGLEERKASFLARYRGPDKGACLFCRDVAWLARVLAEAIPPVRARCQYWLRLIPL